MSAPASAPAHVTHPSLEKSWGDYELDSFVGNDKYLQLKIALMSEFLDGCMVLDTKTKIRKVAEAMGLDCSGPKRPTALNKLEELGFLIAEPANPGDPKNTSKVYRLGNISDENLSRAKFLDAVTPAALSKGKPPSPQAGGAASAPTARGKPHSKAPGKSHGKPEAKALSKVRGDATATHSSGGKSSKAHEDEMKLLKLQIRLAELNLLSGK